jgi:hypothetical protein
MSPRSAAPPATRHREGRPHTEPKPDQGFTVRVTTLADTLQRLYRERRLAAPVTAPSSRDVCHRRDHDLVPGETGGKLILYCRACRERFYPAAGGVRCGCPDPFCHSEFRVGGTEDAP